MADFGMFGEWMLRLASRICCCDERHLSLTCSRGAISVAVINGCFEGGKNLFSVKPVV